MNSTSQAMPLKGTQRSSLFWPKQVLGPPPGLKEINLVCWALFLIFLVIPICVVQWIQVKHGHGSIKQLHSDFVYVYGDGEIARDYPAPRIYDLQLQQRVFDAIYPAQNGIYGPSPYPPFVALFFRPFTYLSFDSAFLLWMVISLVLYVIGIGAVAKTVFPGEGQKISLIFCFALAFFPFLFGTLLNGQLAAVAACAVGLAIGQEQRGRCFVGGLALSLLAYKFTLLPYLLLMLLLTRRFRMLLGFVTGVAALVLATTALAGIRVWGAYLQTVQFFRHATGANSAHQTQFWIHLDLYTCLRALVGRSPIGLAIFACVVAVGAACLAALLWKSGRNDRAVQWLAWATTLTCTLVLNIYVPIYDSVLAVIAVVLTLGALRDLKWSVASEWITFLTVVTLVVSWKTVSIAKSHGIQLLTVMLLILGAAQLVLLYRAIRQPSEFVPGSA